MIPKKNRLNSRSFEHVFKKGKSFSSRSFFLKTLKNDLGYTRVGVGVSKKLTKKAVKRNYYKRVVRHLVKDILSKQTFGYDVVIIANENVHGQKFEELQKEVYELFHKTGVMDN